MKVLMIYPNMGTCLRIPLALAILQAVLKEDGHEVRIFDTTFMSEDYGKDYKYMESRGVVKKTALEDYVGEVEEQDPVTALKAALAAFAPDMLMFSVLERNYSTFRLLGETAKGQRPDLPILAGGILPSIFPEMVLREPFVDWICVGEGETVVRRVAAAWPDRTAITALPNIWSKRNQELVKNPCGPLEDIEAIPDQDWTGFDVRHLYKPFEGNVYTGGSFEWSRGCYNRCAFCVGPALRRVYQATGRTYHRTKSVSKTVDEIVRKKDAYGLTLNAFCDTNFLQAIPEPLLREFCTEYGRRVAVPFMIQTSAESINENKLLMLMDAGCVTASIGVESGSEHIRKNVINKGPARQRIKECFDLCRRHNFRLTANYIIGLPFETEADVYETIRFNREINPPSIAVHFFSPFLGTELYDVSVKHGFYEAYDPNASVYRTTPLRMPQLPAERILEMVQEFTDDFNSWKQEIPVRI